MSIKYLWGHIWKLFTIKLDTKERDISGLREKFLMNAFIYGQSLDKLFILWLLFDYSVRCVRGERESIKSYHYDQCFIIFDEFISAQINVSISEGKIESLRRVKIVRGVWRWKQIVSSPFTKPNRFSICLIKCCILTKLKLNFHWSWDLIDFSNFECLFFRH